MSHARACKQNFVPTFAICRHALPMGMPMYRPDLEEGGEDDNKHVGGKDGGGHVGGEDG